MKWSGDLLSIILLTSQEYWNGDEESAHSTGSTHTGLLEIFVGPGGGERCYIKYLGSIIGRMFIQNRLTLDRQQTLNLIAVVSSVFFQIEIEYKNFLVHYSPSTPVGRLN